VRAIQESRRLTGRLAPFRYILRQSAEWWRGIFIATIIVLFSSISTHGQETQKAKASDQRNVTPERFPFVIPGFDASPSVTDRRTLLHAPAGRDGFVRTEGSHFFAGSQRIRFWGMNLCFSANFPSHDVADRLAPHLAKLGVNAVRFHHMDNQNAPGGIWSHVDANGQRVLDPKMVDRLDYFLARLAEHGIYADLNLHVSRVLTPEEGFPPLKDVPWWAAANKWTTYYDRDVQDRLKDYCRDLLLHRNPYRDNLRRVDDPAIALVEMLNENYFTQQGYGLYRKLPKRYQDSLVAAWNGWLLKRYGSTDRMRTAWLSQQPPLGEYIVPETEFSTGPGQWTVGQNRISVKTEYGISGPPSSSLSAVRLQPESAADQDHACQLRWSGISTTDGEPLTLQFWVRSDQRRNYHVELSTTKDGEWRKLGLHVQLAATSNWTQVTRTIFPGESIENAANLQFSFGDSTVPIEFAGVMLRDGVAPPVFSPSETLERGAVPIPTDTSAAAAHRDMQTFMAETELAWTKEFKRFLTEDLEVRVPITASQVNYHVPSVNLEVSDFLDLHNYWHHPVFPTDANWDPERWTVGNEPMEVDPFRASWPTNSLLMRTGWRYKGKPFTLSEWNYPEPSPYSAGCIPMAAIIAALQDWDAVFFFQYDSESRDSAMWSRDYASSFFSFNGQPVKLASFAVFASVYLRGDLPPLPEELSAPVSTPLDGRLGFSHRLSVSPDVLESPSVTAPEASPLSTPNDSVRWVSDGSSRGHLVLNTPATRGIWGTISMTSAQATGCQFNVDSVDPNYGLLVATSTDGLPLEGTSRAILLAATSSENQQMGWNSERNGVGTRWGTGPTTVVGMTADVTLPMTGRVSVFALDGTGQRMSEVPVTATDNGIRVHLSPQYQTLWYELERQVPAPSR
jgi:hypothetical protein